MKPSAIIYTSKTGHTRQYALLLGKEIGLPVYSYDEAISRLVGGSRVIYLGWIHASYVKGYSSAAKRFSVCAVCGVGLCDTGTLVPEVRKATSIPEDIPLLYPVFLRKTPMRHETGALTFRYLICFPSDIIFL